MLDEFSDVRKTFNDYQEEYAIKLLNVKITEQNPWLGQEIKNISFPDSSLALVIKRGKERIIPKGSTVICLGDTVILSIPTMHDIDDITLKEVVIDKNISGLIKN